MSFVITLHFLSFGFFMVCCIFFVGCLYQVHRLAELVVVGMNVIQFLHLESAWASPRLRVRCSQASLGAVIDGAAHHLV